MSRLRNRQGALEATRGSSAASDLSPVALIGSGSHGEITSWNRAATALLGWNAVDVVGRQLVDVLGCDAVLRVFIEAAEEAGLIHELGRIVLGKSLDVVQAEVVAGRWGGRRLSVNFSSVQMSHPDLETRVIEALSSRCLPGEVLQLELTHTRLLPDIESTVARLFGLRDFGVRLAMDDFGTGYTNMSYLRDLPVEAIKIDARFVAGICTSRSDMAVIRSILSLARELRLDVIVEGVETAAQHFALTRLGCVAAQGFLYSGDRTPADLYRPIELPDRPEHDAFPFPHDPVIAWNGDRLERVLK